jgi:site-specific DNA recombinase
MPTVKKGSSKIVVPELVRVGLYTRISTDEAHQPYSLGAQADRLEAYVKSQENWQIARRYEDQMTGTVLERPGLQAALTDSRRGLYDLLLVFRVDRLARSVRALAAILEELDQVGVAFRSATEPFDTSSPAGRMMVQMLGVFAEFERATLIERVIAGMTKKASQGGWNGGARPFGYDYNRESGCLQVNQDEASVVQDIFDMYVSRRMGTTSIARRLNDRGIRTKQGSLWRADAVITMLSNRAYLGEVLFRDQSYEGKHPPIVSASTFENANKTLRERGEIAANRRTNTSAYPLAGILVCQKCGSRFVGTGANGNGGNYRYYICCNRQSFGTGNCDQDRIPAEKVEDAVLQRIRSTLEDGKVLRNALQLFEESWSQDDPARTKEANRIDKEITKTKSAIDRYLLAFEEGTMPVEGCGHRIQELTEKLTGLEGRKAEIELEAAQPRDLPKIEDVKDGAQKVIAMIEQFQSDQVPSLKELLRKLLPKIEVENGSTVYPVIHLPVVLINSGWVGPAGIEPATNRL